MKKSYIIIISIIILLLILGVAIIINNLIKNNTLDNQTKVIKELANQNNNEVEVVTTSTSKIKTSPNTKFIFKTYYKKCEHITSKTVNISEEFINKDEEEIRLSYKDWKIEKFNIDEVIFYKQEEGICDEHYIIKDNNGYIAIYFLDNNENEKLKEVTGIVTNYLPDIDKQNLKEGIKVIGEEQLNSCLEDYE